MSKTIIYYMLDRETAAMRNASTGSIFTHLTKGLMEGLKLVVPPPELISATEGVFTDLAISISANIKESSLLARKRDTLLPQLLSGKLPVPAALTRAEEALA